MSNKVAAIIVAAGEGERMGGIDKMFATIHGRPVLAHVLDTFQDCKKIDRIIVVMNAKNIENCRSLVAHENWDKVRDICLGGKKRQESVLEGLKRIKEVDWVVIHDGARPLVTIDLIERGLEAAKETGAAAAAIPLTDTIKFIKGSDIVLQTLPRENLRAAQTPQVFRVDVIKNTYKFAVGEFTDDAALVEKAGYKVRLFAGSYDNIKITRPDDLAIAEVLLK
jgi:2-C-methyl-D-erythritol 4-phosphate cytidylyltransferase